MDPRVLLFVLAGLGLWAAVALERPLRRLPLSLPMIYVALGWAAWTLPLGLPRLDPIGTPAHTATTEYLTEFIVIVSLMGAGLAIDRPFSWAGWKQVMPLLAITMPLTILAVAGLGWAWLGLAPASALLLAAALSPTDPVLARSVQVGPPGESDCDDVRFNLTVEAGINDGLAFPFTYLAIAVAGQSAFGGWVGEWVALDVLWRTCAGLVVGIAVGRAVGWFLLRHEEKMGQDVPKTGHANAGVTVMGTLLAAYGLAELVEGYGFLAVFAGAVAARQYKPESAYHERTHQFMDQLERIVLIAMLLGLGGLAASGAMSALTVPAALVGAAVVLIVRPMAGAVGMVGSALPWAGRLAVAFLGIRGLGTIYYLAYGQAHGAFEGLDLLWATALFVILLSIVVHGVTAESFMRRLDRNNDNVASGAGPENADAAPIPKQSQS